MEVILCGLRLCPLVASQLSRSIAPQALHPFSWRVTHVCGQLSLLTHFLSLSLPVQASPVSADVTFGKTWCVSYLSQGLTQLDKRILQRSFLVSPFLVFLFKWLIGSVNHSMLQKKVYTSSLSRAHFPHSESPNFSILTVWIGWKFPKWSRLVPFCLNFLPQFLFSLTSIIIKL